MMGDKPWSACSSEGVCEDGTVLGQWRLLLRRSRGGGEESRRTDTGLGGRSMRWRGVVWWLRTAWLATGSWNPGKMGKWSRQARQKSGSISMMSPLSVVEESPAANAGRGDLEDVVGEFKVSLREAYFNMLRVCTRRGGQQAAGSSCYSTSTPATPGRPPDSYGCPRRLTLCPQRPQRPGSP
jgi:hypothetical protein